MRPDRGDDADGRDVNRRVVDRRDDGRFDVGRLKGDRRGAAAGTETDAGVLPAMVGGRAMLVACARRVARVPGELSRGRVVGVLRAPVEAAGIEKGSLKPDGPEGDEGAEPRRAIHDVQITRGAAQRLMTGDIAAILGYGLVRWPRSWARSRTTHVGRLNSDQRSPWAEKHSRAST